ncbi:hypothetical protein [Tenacibaculum amylolyticum]|uniref:hypothetical protein n=1 Tax=Tenacibaculum amylolyticum TaxID=104269 RepID=UPI0038952E02
MEIEKYLDSIAASINEASVISEATSVAIRKQFSEDFLLRNFSVPRFKTQEVALTIPVGTREVREQPSNYEPFDKSEFFEKTLNILRRFTNEVFKKRSKEIDRDRLNRLRAIIEERVNVLRAAIKSSGRISSELNLYARYLAEQFNVLYQTETPNRIYRQIVYAINEEQRQDIYPVPPAKPPQTKIVLESSELRNVASKDFFKINMTINDGTMEWNYLED